MVAHQLWELGVAGSNPVAPTSQQLQERIVDYLFRNPKPHTFYQIREGLQIPDHGDGCVAVLPVLTVLRAQDLVQRVEAPKGVNRSPRFLLTVNTWLRLARRHRAVGKRRSRPSGGREIAGSIPAGPTMEP